MITDRPFLLPAFLLSSLLSFSLTQQANAANTDLSPYISTLEAAAEVCDNSVFSTSACTTTCTTSAEQLSQAETIAGVQGDTERALTRCMTAMAVNEDGRDSPLFAQVSKLQAELSAALFKHRIDQRARAALTQPDARAPQTNVAVPITSTSIYSADGAVDPSKIPALYDDLSRRCQSLGSAMMQRLCRSMCLSKETEVGNIVKTIEQAPNNISPAQRERNTYTLLVTIETDLSSSCAKQFAGMPSADQPKAYSSIRELIDLIKTGKWPPRPEAELALLKAKPTPAAPVAQAAAKTPRSQPTSQPVGDKNHELYLQLLDRERFSEWLNTHEHDATAALKFLDATARSASYQLELASGDKFRLIESSLHGVDYLYGQYPGANRSTKPGRKAKPRPVQVKVLDMVQCIQAPALWRQLSKDPSVATYQHLNKTALAVQACYLRVWQASRHFDFEDFETARSIGGAIEQQVRERGELKLKTYAPVAREQMRMTGFNYAQLYAAHLVTRKLDRLKSTFRDSLGGDANAGLEDFTALVGKEYRRITGIGLEEKDKAKTMINQQMLAMKQQALREKLGGATEPDPTPAVTPGSRSALKMQFFGRCVAGVEKQYYNCDCLADAYVQQKVDDPALTDYQFGQGPAYGKCYDAQATAKTEALACENLKLGIFDCNCHGSTYVEMLEAAGIRRPTDRRAISMKSIALAACPAAGSNR